MDLRRRNQLITIGGIWLCVLSASALCEKAADQCLLETLQSVPSDFTVGEVRALCEQSIQAEFDRQPSYDQATIRERIQLERFAEDSPFAITPHFPNFLLYSTFDANQAPFEPLTNQSDTVQDHEAVFQVSFKAPLWRNVLNTNLSAYFAYTSRSWWQVANDEFSKPFRETNYMPEIFIRSIKRRQFLGASLDGWSLGLVHESNGREQALSRSWNRVMARYGIQMSDTISLHGQLWYRIPDDEEDDDNPNEHRFYGYGDLRAVWTPNRNTVTALIRPGTQHTSYELTWSRPLNEVFRLYAAYYNGYGDSLLDYNVKTERFSIGIALNDYQSRY